jgi:hypothetical protein
MATVKIEKWWYETGLNKTKVWAYQAHVEDEGGAWVKEAPVRDTLEEAEDDARLIRVRDTWEQAEEDARLMHE